MRFSAVLAALNNGFSNVPGVPKCSNVPFSQFGTLWYQNKKASPNRRGSKKAFCFNLSASRLRSHLPPDDIQRAAGFEPFYLLCIIRMVNRERILGAIAMVQHNG